MTSTDSLKIIDFYVTKYVANKQGYYNEQRPCYALGYDTPSNYRKRYYKGEIEHKNTFEKRELSDVPKFVQNRSK